MYTQKVANQLTDDSIHINMHMSIVKELSMSLKCMDHVYLQQFPFSPLNTFKKAGIYIINAIKNGVDWAVFVANVAKESVMDPFDSDESLSQMILMSDIQ